MRKLYPSIFVFFISAVMNVCFSQNKTEIDSLYKIVSTSKNDSVKVMTLNKIAFGYIFNDINKAKTILNQSQVIAQKSNFKYGLNDILNNRGILMDVSGISDSAYYYFNQSLLFGKKNNFKKFQVKALNNIGMYFWNTGKFNNALHYFFEALKFNESVPKVDQINNSVCFSNIGLIYQELDLNNKALEYHKKAYEIRKKDKANFILSTSLNNIGICYHLLGKNKLAIATYKEGLQIAKTYGNNVDYYKILENIGNALQSEGEYKESIGYYEQGLLNPEKSPKINLGIYSGLVAAYNELNKPSKALEYAKEGLQIVKDNPELRNFATTLYQYTAQSYYMLGDVKKGEAYNSEFIGITKDVFSENNSKQIAQYEIKYETEKKEKLLAENKVKLLQNEAENKKKNDILIAVLVLAISLGLIGYLIYRQQKLKNIQQVQEFELQSAIAKIENQNKLQEQRLSISRDLHDNIGAQLTFIISSIDNIKYAFDIQNDKLNSKLVNISNFTRDTIIELRDTIWAMNSKEITFENLQSRINNFIEKARETDGAIDINFQVDKNLKKVHFSSVKGMNIYRTIQEAIHNSLKYANASSIKILAENKDENIKISIIDNGKGFDLSTTEKGNGLQNMKKRIEDINGKFILNSSTKGTIIEIII